jgi:predicted Zn-dependent peptidase
MSDPRYYAARLAETILSGGMSSRLFSEVREKRGLVYSIGAHYHTLKDHAGLFTYAGTRPEVAQQTLDVTLGELHRLGEGVTEDEMARARTQLKAALVMQGESTPARANAIASDWYLLGRLRSLQEISDAIDAVVAEDVVGFLKEFPPSPLTVLVVGPEALKL